MDFGGCSVKNLKWLIIFVMLTKTLKSQKKKKEIAKNSGKAPKIFPLT